MLKGSLFVYCFVVPIDQTKGIKMLYEFVDMDAVDTVRHNFEAGKSLALNCGHNPVCDNTSSMSK